MTTRRTRGIVSLAASLTLTLALGACAGGPARPASSGPALTEAPSLTIRFDNDGREHVHVYLVGRKQEWLLGRVEAGTSRTLTIPPASYGGSGETVRLAVIAGERPTLQAARNPRAMLTLSQRATDLVSQRWMLTQGQLTSLPRWRGRAVMREP